VDPSLGAVMAADRLAKKLGIQAYFVAADARYLPFDSESIDSVFSYSVLQHFSDEDAEQALEEIARVLKHEGQSRIQMANRVGIRSIWHQLRQRYRDPGIFDVRYRSTSVLKKMFHRIIGPTRLEVDCYFGLGLQSTDRNMMSVPKKIVLSASEAIKEISKLIKPLRLLADSVYILSTKR